MSNLLIFWSDIMRKLLKILRSGRGSIQTFSMSVDKYTWANLPYTEVGKSGHRTADLGSSNHTFFHGLELPTLAVLWPRCRTADLGSSMASFQHFCTFRHWHIPADALLFITLSGPISVSGMLAWGAWDMCRLVSTPPGSAPEGNSVIFSALAIEE